MYTVFAVREYPCHVGVRRLATTDPALTLCKRATTFAVINYIVLFFIFSIAWQAARAAPSTAARAAYHM